MEIHEKKLELVDAVKLKRAELWLEVREPLLALQELDGLPVEVWIHPWARRILEAACLIGAREIAPSARGAAGRLLPS